MMRITEQVDRRDLLNWYVGVLVVLQIAGLLLVSSALDHDPDPLAAWIQNLQPGVRSLLSPLVVVAIPAIVLTLIVGVIVGVIVDSTLRLAGVGLAGVVITFSMYLLFLAISYGLAVLAVSAVRRGRIAPGTRLPATPTPAAESRWWYWIVAYVLHVGVVLGGGAVAFWFGLPLLPPFGTPASILLLVVGAVIFPLALLAIYLEGRSLQEAGSEWRPPYVLYMIGIAVGTVTYPIGPLVALHYLLLRHRHLGAR